ncbi:hypothetical protein ACFSYH_03840 [Populibacterium corticicola]|jgi:hypothetical protein|uniref:Uncharacterized protein n=1 Tax=Populibacterium corticicola TaxID=1812826 RepID=A0ABW5XFT8_9MICO
MTTHFDPTVPPTPTEDLLGLGDALDVADVEEHTPIFESLIEELKIELDL